jgi:hypothetical protein
MDILLLDIDGSIAIQENCTSLVHQKTEDSETESGIVLIQNFADGSAINNMRSAILAGIRFISERRCAELLNVFG